MQTKPVAIFTRDPFPSGLVLFWQRQSRQTWGQHKAYYAPGIYLYLTMSEARSANGLFRCTVSPLRHRG